jgi:hypoxanthine-DNA glycosylase
MTIKQSMSPAGSTDAKLLILGSLPGEASLAAQRYYAHPLNQFWRLLGGALDEPLADLPYEQRLIRLAERDVALWDVIGTARRLGSLDGAIRDVTANPLRDYIATHPRLCAVAFNGKTAARLGRQAIGDPGTIELVDLPSSSPAYTIPLAEKAKRWALLASLACPAKVATLHP